MTASRYSRHTTAREWFLPVSLGACLLTLSGCLVGPRYKRPAASTPAAYKEQGAGAQPSVQNLAEKWWEIFGDPQLNALEEQIKVSNQSLKQSEAQYRQARALVRSVRSQYYPTVTAGLSATPTHISDHRPPGVSRLSGSTFTDYQVPADVSYEVDAWGRVRRTVESARESAQASAADLATINLSLQAELAVDYFESRSSDAQKKLLDSTVLDYEKALQLTENRHEGGLASDVDVEQARTQLETTRAQDIDVGVARAQFEHAIAVLIGKPAAEFSLAFAPASEPPPQVPVGIPSQLLERRPDIAAGERRMAAANAQIGVAKAAYFPTLTLTASGGFESGALGTLIQGPSGFWSLGAGAVETVFDAGRRRAATEQAQAAYDQTVASYRETVLTAFQDVEDNLAALRILENEAKTQDVAVTAAQRSLMLSEQRYRGGLVNYLEVLTAQSTLLADQRTAVDILRRRIDASVLLIKALGGGWDVTTGIPKAESMATAGGGGH